MHPNHTHRNHPSSFGHHPGARRHHPGWGPGPGDGHGGPGHGRGRSGRGFGSGGGPDGRWRGPGGSGGRRGRRGDVRAAILALLAERPMHGYEMLQELSSRTAELWRPSPGSLYPALQYLEDQGLIVAVDTDGRRLFELTEAGRVQAASRQGPPPWEAVVGDADQGDVTLAGLLRQVFVAAGQVAEAGSPEQKVEAARLLTELRRNLYLLLAADPGPTT